MVQRLIQGMKLREKKCTLTKKSRTLNRVHPHLKDAALFSSVSKAKASVTAPAAIRTLCANARKMKPTSTTEAANVNDTFYLSPTLRPADLFAVSLRMALLLGGTGRLRCSRDFCCLDALKPRTCCCILDADTYLLETVVFKEPTKLFFL